MSLDEFSKSQQEQDHAGVPGLLDVLPDGSVLRSEFITPFVEASPSSFTRDVVVDSGTGVTARIFLPASAAECKKSGHSIIVYFHGGCFCLCNAGTVYFHHHCADLSRRANAVVVSINYRLAPEHRLPAAYEDGARALQWLARHCSSDSPTPIESVKLEETVVVDRLDPWILSLADFSRCFLMGEGSGANIIHHLMLNRRGDQTSCRWSLSVNGLVLVHPFFGGEDRTPSETKFATVDMVAPADMLDEFWKYALPLGADRNHRFANPFGDEEVTSLSEVEFPRTMIVVGGRNSLQDRQVEYFSLLKKSGKVVLLLFLKNAMHAFEFLEGQVDQAGILFQFIDRFISGKNTQSYEE